MLLIAKYLSKSSGGSVELEETEGNYLRHTEILPLQQWSCFQGGLEFAEHFPTMEFKEMDPNRFENVLKPLPEGDRKTRIRDVLVPSRG
jgi:hypothetical protein